MAYYDFLDSFEKTFQNKLKENDIDRVGIVMSLCLEAFRDCDLSQRLISRQPDHKSESNVAAEPHQERTKHSDLIDQYFVITGDPEDKISFQDINQILEKRVPLRDLKSLLLSYGVKNKTIKAKIDGVLKSRVYYTGLQVKD